MRQRLRKLRLRREEAGYSLIELITVCAIMGIVISGVTSVFASGAKAERDMNNRFRAQNQTRLVLDKLRRDIHCASTASTTTTSVTLTVPVGCSTSGSNTSVTWCTGPGTAGRYKLYRYEGSGSCTAGVRWGDYFMQDTGLFTFTQQSKDSLAKLRVYLPVNTRENSNARTYVLSDNIYLRNSSRSCVVGSPSPPC